MAYLEGLLYRPEGSHPTEETQAGVPKYAGHAWNFEEWKFRVLNKKKAIETNFIWAKNVFIHFNQEEGYVS